MFFNIFFYEITFSFTLNLILKINKKKIVFLNAFRKSENKCQNISYSGQLRLV